MTSAPRLAFLANIAFGLLAFPALAEEPPSSSGATDAPAASAAAGPTAVSERSAGRELGGHTFLPVQGIVGPFTATSFGTFLTAGAGSTQGSVSLQIPGGPSTPQTFSGTVSYAAIGGVIGYEYAFLGNFAARAAFSETLYSGTTGASAAVVGTNGRFGADVGLTGGVTIGESLRVAGVFDASYTPRIGLLVGPAIKSAFDSCAMGLADCSFDFAKLFDQENILRLTPGVALGWAPVKALGVTSNFSYSYSSVDTLGSSVVSQGALSFGLAVDFDFGSISSVPLGLQAMFNSEVSIAGTDTTPFTDLGGGLFYTGRKELSLGLQLLDRRFRVVPEVDVSWSTLVALIGLRYYWQ